MKFLGIKYHLLCCLLSVLFLLNVPVPAYAADVNNSSLSGDATITNPGLSTQAPVNSLAGATSGGAASTSSSGEDALTETTLSGVSALTSLAKRTVMTAITKGLIKVNTQTGDDKLTHYIITTGLGAGTSLTLTQMKAQLNAISGQITQVQSSVDHMNASMESQFTQASQTQLREAYYDDLSELDEIYTDVNDKWTNYNNYMLAAFDYVATDNGQPIENADGSYKILGDTPEEVAENTKLYNDAIKQAQDYLDHNVNMSDMDKYISRVQSIAVSTSANPSVYDRFDAYATACYPFTYQTVGPANALLQYVSGIQYEAYLLYSERAYDNVLDNPDQASDYNDYVQQHYNTVVNTVNTAVDNTDIIDRLNAEGFDTSQFTEDGDNDIDKAIYKRDDNNEITEDLLLDSLVVSIPLDDYYKGATTGGTVAGYRVTTQDNVSLIIATQAVKIGDYMETVNGVTQLSIPMVSKDGRYEIIPSYDSINSLFKMAAVTPVDAYNWLATAGGLVNLETMQANLMLTQQDSASNKTYMEYQGMECDNFDTAGADYALRTISLQDGGSGHPIVLGDGRGQIDNAKDATLALIYFDRTQRFENNVDKVTTYGGSFDDSSDYYLREGETLDISEMNGDE